MMIEVVLPKFEILSNTNGMEQQIERFGRTCYKSEGRITKDSANKFIRMIVKSGHHSVLEHCSVTVLILCSRACSHQLVRHRIAAYSQESQRYCDYGQKGLKVICPPSIGLEPGCYQFNKDTWSKFENPVPITFRQRAWLNTIEHCYAEYLSERLDGIKPEDARFVLPNATKTEVVTTFNLRQWRHVFGVRCKIQAQWEIREIMRELLTRFKEILPCFFEDMDV
jgi:thymidylate synthase (FAD)